MDFDFLTRYINVPLLKEPVNWAIIWVFATVWLLAFHVIMQAWTAMSSGGPAAIGAGPGQIASPVAGATNQFSIAGNYGPGDPNMSAFHSEPFNRWTDGFESKYAEDGWTGVNP